MNIFKKIFRLAIVLLLATPIIFVSTNCTRDQHHTNKVSEITSLRMAISRLNILDQRVIFNGLPAEYKYALWEDHYQHHLKKTKKSDQKDFIQGMLNMLAVEDYADTAFYSTPKADQLKLKVGEALILYNHDSTKVAGLLFSLGSGNSHLSLLAGGHLHDCNCATSSDWCWDDCLAADCNTSSHGCGTSGLYKCDGMCTDKD